MIKDWMTTPLQYHMGNRYLPDWLTIPRTVNGKTWLQLLLWAVNHADPQSPSDPTFNLLRQIPYSLDEGWYYTVLHLPSLENANVKRNHMLIAWANKHLTPRQLVLPTFEEVMK